MPVRSFPRANAASLWANGDVGFALATLGITLVVPLWRLWAIRRSVTVALCGSASHVPPGNLMIWIAFPAPRRYTSSQLISSLLHADVLVDTINTGRGKGDAARQAENASILHVEHGRRPSLATTQTAKSLLQSIPMAMLQVRPPQWVGTVCGKRH